MKNNFCIIAKKKTTPAVLPFILPPFILILVEGVSLDIKYNLEFRITSWVSIVLD